MYQDLLGKYDSLVREVLAMKRDGFTPPLPEGVPQTPKELPPDVRQVIGEIALGDGELTRILTATAWQMVEAGMAVGDITQRIREGEEATL